MDKFVTKYEKKHNRKFGWKYYKCTRNLSKRVGRYEIIQQKENNENSPSNIQTSNKKASFKIFT